MKRLLLMRHAKSSWDEAGLPDHDRPLAARGQQDAPRMGRWLAAQTSRPDKIISSTAIRACHTAELMAQACGYTGEILYTPDLYHATPATYRRVAQAWGGDAPCLMLIGHNPGLEMLATQLSGQQLVLPTAAVVYLTLSLTQWEDWAGAAAAQLVALWRPKALPATWA